MSKFYDVFKSPMGNIYIICDENSIVRVELTEEGFEKYSHKDKELIKGSPLCVEAARQLKEYFQGSRREFDLRLELEQQGTEFQRKVWKALLEIPYGETRCYGDIARNINNPKASQAIGQANRSNYIPIFIPCHRVIGKTGKLVGYAGDRTDLQEILLRLEGVIKDSKY